MAAEIQISNRQTEPVDTRSVRRLVRLVLDQEGATWVNEVSISYVDSERMKELNLGYRGIDAPTDVLAFPMDCTPGDEAGPSCLGDVVVCPEVVRRQAAGYRQTYEKELALVLVHGVLHLLGWDHQAAGDRLAMRRRECDILDRFSGS